MKRPKFCETPNNPECKFRYIAKLRKLQKKIASQKSVAKRNKIEEKINKFKNIYNIQ